MNWKRLFFKNKKIFIAFLCILFVVLMFIVFIVQQSSKKTSQEKRTSETKNTEEDTKTQDVSEKEMAQTEELFLNDPVNKIKQKLPYQTDNFEISYFLDKDNKTIFSITIYNNFKKSKNEALDWFKKQEIDPEKIEIVYFDKTQPSPAQKEDQEHYKGMYEEQNEYIE